MSSLLRQKVLDSRLFSMGFAAGVLLFCLFTCIFRSFEIEVIFIITLFWVDIRLDGTKVIKGVHP